MALARLSLTVQLMSGVGVFAHVCRQTADTSSNYYDNIQPYDKPFHIFSNVTLREMQMQMWNYEKSELLTFAR